MMVNIELEDIDNYDLTYNADAANNIAKTNASLN